MVFLISFFPQKILENLSFHEVAKLRLVCRTWADVGEMILAKRRPLHYFTIHPHCIPTTLGKVHVCRRVCMQK